MSFLDFNYVPSYSSSIYFAIFSSDCGSVVLPLVVFLDLWWTEAEAIMQGLNEEGMATGYRLDRIGVMDVACQLNGLWCDLNSGVLSVSVDVKWWSVRAICCHYSDMRLTPRTSPLTLRWIFKSFLSRRSGCCCKPLATRSLRSSSSLRQVCWVLFSSPCVW